jgi:hypothetical protein
MLDPATVRSIRPARPRLADRHRPNGCRIHRHWSGVADPIDRLLEEALASSQLLDPPQHSVEGLGETRVQLDELGQEIEISGRESGDSVESNPIGIRACRESINDRVHVGEALALARTDTETPNPIVHAAVRR